MMKATIVFLTLALLTASAEFADSTLTMDGVGASIAVPDGWKHDEDNRFGYLIRPEGEKNKKIRVHLTGYKNASPADAVLRGAEKIRQAREKGKQPVETILSSDPITTDSGIEGQMAEVGQQGADGPSYLTRIYFQRPDGRIFCVCIYHYGDMEFAVKVRTKVVKTLKLEA